MDYENTKLIEEAKKAAVSVLLYNTEGPFLGLPRTAGFGYPEPYTRDLMLSILGVGVSGNEKLIKSTRKVLEKLAQNQSPKGHIPSLVHEVDNKGASDTTPLFLLGVSVFRRIVGEPLFLEKAVKKSLTWMEYQSPNDEYLVAQLPTSDWRDEQWVIGYGLFVNTLVFSFLMLLGCRERASKLFKEIRFLNLDKNSELGGVGRLLWENPPYYSLWRYKVFRSDRFDLLGNSLAILSGIASLKRASAIIEWIEKWCQIQKNEGKQTSDLPPNFFPFIEPGDPDWHSRYSKYNMPGEYHNGGIWPFVCSIYVSSLVAAHQYELAETKLVSLTHMIKKSKDSKLPFGFNEWVRSIDDLPCGQDWQSWSAALYLYAAKCVQERKTPFFDEIREEVAKRFQ
ncbi:amylo-alpha-1,6-glucosidase [Echinicola sp. CAU 1574]|uniref:beta-fructofuranosidase n=1 Tax=Echinicola arenosa TaxID=2774144 RepID=A0ABR9AHE7_9BACT|nr:amylo-alpha-1,6-glucosidase [Echinicola arenosa]MBD8488231.1 amylo-alpha-1,6-glucosidase [Echinicola arenosa]